MADALGTKTVQEVRVGTAVISPQAQPIARRIELAPTQASRLRVAALVVLVAAVVGAFWAVRPQLLGGGVSYVVSRGASMEPNLQDGDLVVLHQAASYEVGDVVAYESASLGRTVIHRITAVQDGRYLMRGDANDSVDPDRPTTGDIIGRTTARVPGAGDIAAQMRRPAIFVLSLAFLACLAMSALALRKREPTPRPAVAAPVTTQVPGASWRAEGVA